MSKTYTSVTTANVIERRFELQDKLKELQLPKDPSSAEYDRIYDERLAIVQEFVDINHYLGEYDNETK